MDAATIAKLEGHLKRTFGNPHIALKARPKQKDSAEVEVAGEFIGVIFQVGDLDSTAASNLALGGTLTLALLGLAIGVVVWSRMVLPKYSMIQERHTMSSDPRTKGEDPSSRLAHVVERPDRHA